MTRRMTVHRGLSFHGQDITFHEHHDLAGQVGIGGHLKIGNQVTVGAQSGVMTDIPDKATWLGAPAQPDKQFKRQVIAIQRLPDLLRRIAEFERKFGVKLDGGAE